MAFLRAGAGRVGTGRWRSGSLPRRLNIRRPASLDFLDGPLQTRDAQYEGNKRVP